MKPMKLMKPMIQPSKTYPLYKCTPIEWLGNVPKHWVVLPIRALMKEVNDRDNPNKPLLSVTIKKGVIQQNTLLATSNNKDISNLDRSNYKLAKHYDIIYNKMRAWQGAIGVSEFTGIVSPAYVVERPRNGVNPRYYHYLFRTPAFVKECERWSYGIASDMWSLRPEHFRLIYACLPPTDEQSDIVRFLDHTDQLLQRYIYSKEKLLSLLEEQKQTVVHQAVTGLIDVRTGNSYPAYKPSGVTWLGDVPMHWKIRRGGWLFRKMDRPVRDTDEVVTCFRDGTVTLRKNRRTEGFTESLKEIGYQGVRKGDLVIHQMDAFAGAVGVSDSDGKGTPVYSVCHPTPAVDPFYYAYTVREMARNKWIQALAKGIRERSTDFRYAEFAKQYLPLPPFAEQTAISQYLDKSTTDIDTAKRCTHRQIEFIVEYRTRLIADVVTGRLDVREAASHLTNDSAAMDMTEWIYQKQLR